MVDETIPLVVRVFKHVPDDELIEELRTRGFKVYPAARVLKVGAIRTINKSVLMIRPSLRSNAEENIAHGIAWEMLSRQTIVFTERPLEHAGAIEVRGDARIILPKEAGNADPGTTR